MRGVWVSAIVTALVAAATRLEGKTETAPSSDDLNKAMPAPTLAAATADPKDFAHLYGETEEILKKRKRSGKVLKNIIIAKIPAPQVGMVLPKAFFTAGVATRNPGGGGWSSGGSSGWGGGGGGGGGGNVGWGQGGGGGGGGGGWGQGGGGGGGGWGQGGGGGGGVGGGWGQGGGGGGGWGQGGGGGGGIGGGWGQGGGGGGGWGQVGGGGGGGWGQPGGWGGGWLMQCETDKVKKAKAKAKKKIAKAQAKAKKKAIKAAAKGGGGWGWGPPPGWGSGGGGGGGGGSKKGGWGPPPGWGSGGGGGGWIRANSGGGSTSVGGGVGGASGGSGWSQGSSSGGNDNDWRSFNTNSVVIDAPPTRIKDSDEVSDEVWPNSPPRAARVDQVPPMIPSTYQLIADVASPDQYLPVSLAPAVNQRPSLDPFESGAIPANAISALSDMPQLLQLRLVCDQSVNGHTANCYYVKY